MHPGDSILKLNKIFDKEEITVDEHDANLEVIIHQGNEDPSAFSPLRKQRLAQMRGHRGLFKLRDNGVRQFRKKDLKRIAPLSSKAVKIGELKRLETGR